MCGLLMIQKKGSSEAFIQKQLSTISHRGPDDTQVVEVAAGVWFGFVRLAIQDLSEQGNQPFRSPSWSVMCNGEIFNHVRLKRESAFDYQSQSDCEVLLPLLENRGLKSVANALDAEFAFVAYDHEKKRIVAARDAVGIRPLFFGYQESGEIAFSSEAKALHDVCQNVEPFPPGYIFDSEKGFEPYCQIEKVEAPYVTEVKVIDQKIKEHLVSAVQKRLDADAPVGFLLSGGLDSSLVCSIAARHSKKPIRTFAIGTEHDAIDVKYAQQVADHIGSDHTTVRFSPEDVVKALPKVIQHLETWDITTVRASVGMYLICKHIHEQTDIKVLLTGEVSDEIFGYKYTDFAPSPEAFQSEAEKRLRELHIYDVLRADRCIAAHSLEARVPFADRKFVEFVMSIDPKLKMNTYNKGKYILRRAFVEGDYLPRELLMREKAAFSDAVGHSMVDDLKLLAEKRYKPIDLKKSKLRFPHGTPISYESLMYREIFEEFYPGRSKLIPSFWMPNQSWQNCDVKDPSARVLPNYGSSGL